MTTANISLAKGQNISLNKVAPGLTRATIGLGWKARGTPGAPFDLDGWALLLDANGKLVAEKDFVFYNNLANPSGSVTHSGDNRTGDAQGDDETLTIDFSKIPANVEKVLVGASIYEADVRKQTFGQVSEAYVRIVDPADPSKSITRFDLSEDACMDTAMVFAEFYRHNGEWKERALETGTPGGLDKILATYT